jgi:hypothetical protein
MRPRAHTEPEAQAAAMEAFFSMAENRVEFIEDLVNRGRYPEALILCSTYIDAFAHWLYWPRKGVGENFVDALGRYELAPFFALVHPLQMIRSLNRQKEPWKSRAKRVEGLFLGPDYQLVTRENFAAVLAPHFSALERSELEQQLWRGTVGGIAYDMLRNPSVHHFAGNWSVLFENTYLHGKWVGLFGIDRLLPPLKAMLEAAKARSLSSGYWFGNDAIIEAT